MFSVPFALVSLGFMLKALVSRFSSRSLPTWWYPAIQSGQRFLSVELHCEPLRLQLQSPNSGSQLRLPLYPLNTLPPRLSSHIVDGKLECIQLESFLDLQKVIVARDGPIFVEGASGVGKSFALYHLFCALSSYPTHRVLYIPDCSLLVDSGPLHVLQALTAAFSLDAVLLSNLECYARCLASFDCDAVLSMISDYCRERGLVFYAIFDQYEAVARYSKTSALVDVLAWSEYLSSPHKIIFSASSNNDYEPLEALEDSTETVWYLGCFTAKELKSWQRLTHFFPKRDLAIAKEYLGLVPLEWTLMNEYRRRRSELKTLEEMLCSYSEQRKEDLVKAHKKWLQRAKRAAESEKVFNRRYRETLIAASAAAPLLDPLYDRQLFFVHPSEHIVTPIVPITMKIVEGIIKTSFGEEDWQSMLEAGNFQRIPGSREGKVEVGTFQRFPDSAARGKVATSYIVHRIIIDKSISMEAKEIQFNERGEQNADAQTVAVKVGALQIQWLHTLLAPLSNPTCNMLYINCNPTQHDVDFFIWDHERKHLWLFKGAVGSCHSKAFTNTWNEPSQQHTIWRSILPHDFTFKRVWIVDADPTIQTLAGQAFVLEAYFNIADDRRFDLNPYPALKHYGDGLVE